MATSASEPSLLDLGEVVIQKSTRGHFFTEVAITTPTNSPLGFAKVSGSKTLLAINEFSGGWLFPSRPMDLQDKNGHPVLRIELSGILRRFTVTVKRLDGSTLGRLVGKTWATTLRSTDFWVEVGDERVGQIHVEKRSFRVVDPTGSVLAEIDRTPAPKRTTLQRADHLSEPLVALMLAAAIIRHRL